VIGAASGPQKICTTYSQRFSSEINGGRKPGGNREQNKLSQVHLAKTAIKLECGAMPNVMAAQPNIGGALCESSIIPFFLPHCKVGLMPTAGVPCSFRCQHKRTQDLNVK